MPARKKITQATRDRLKALRKKFGLGEFSGRKPKARRGSSRRAGVRPVTRRSKFFGGSLSAGDIDGAQTAGLWSVNGQDG